MNLVDRLFASARAAEKTALVTETSEHSYGELARAMNAVASRLLREGVQPGEPVGLLSENSFFSLAAYLGILRAGACAVPLPTNIAAAQLGSIVQSTGMQRAFVQEKIFEDVAVPLAPLKARLVESDFTAMLEEPWREFPAVGSDDLALLMFTSGSTQAPRGVMLSHANVIANTGSILGYLPLRDDDRVMLVLPLYYSFGASVLHTHLALGATVVMDKRFLFPDKVLKRMQELRCTGFAGVPSHYQILLRRSKLKTLSFPDLRWLQQAGGKLAASFVDELREAFPQVPLFLMYGSTEATARIAYLPPERLAEKRDCVGRAIPGVTLHLLAEDGTPVPAGETGEIVVEGPNVSRGYWNAPEETAATFKQGRLHTGDLARQDAEGFVYIVDRAKDFIKVGGSRTSSKAIEEAYLRFPELVEVAVLPVPDETLGEAIAAFLVPRDPRDSTVAERFLGFCKETLSPGWIPKQVKVLGALPKNNAGKVLKRQLRGD